MFSQEHLSSFKLSLNNGDFNYWVLLRLYDNSWDLIGLLQMVTEKKHSYLWVKRWTSLHCPDWRRGCQAAGWVQTKETPPSPWTVPALSVSDKRGENEDWNQKRRQKGPEVHFLLTAERFHCHKVCCSRDWSRRDTLQWAAGPRFSGRLSLERNKSKKHKYYILQYHSSSTFSVSPQSNILI